jgi:geranylgeranyl pyrophosphate synthase
MTISTATDADLAALFQFFQEEFKGFINRKYPDNHRVHEAIRYALNGPGKKIRPLLCLSSAIAVGGRPEQALIPAIAVEMLHTYSLVHDDLPAMDNDDMRRGRPTVHVAFDEAIAILVGDALQTDAISLLADTATAEWIPKAEAIPAKGALAIIAELGRAAGGHGMVLGQAIDMEWTGKTAGQLAELDRLHQLKTGVLLGASCAVGALSCKDSTPEDINRLRSFGEAIGLAFQIRDDIIDSFAQTGKTANKDANSGKFTYLSLMGADAAMVRARQLTENSLDNLPNTSSYALLRKIAINLMDRTG